MLALTELSLKWHWKGLAETWIILDRSNAVVTYEKERRKQGVIVRGQQVGVEEKFL